MHLPGPNRGHTILKASSQQDNVPYNITALFYSLTGCFLLRVKTIQVLISHICRIF